MFGLLAASANLAYSQETGSEDCVSQAMANADPGNAVGEALSNAVASTITQTFSCGQDTGPNPNAVSGLSVALALAISESRSVGENCIAVGDASAEGVTNYVGQSVGNDIVAGFVDGFQGESAMMANAWLESERQGVIDIIQNGERNRGPVLNGQGCLSLPSLANGLPTAVELGVLLDSAIRQILEAVQCGKNYEVADTKCTYSNKIFRGQCLPRDQSEQPPAQRDCAREFDECRYAGRKGCFAEKVKCWQASQNKGSYHG